MKIRSLALVFLRSAAVFSAAGLATSLTFADTLEWTGALSVSGTPNIGWQGNTGGVTNWNNTTTAINNVAPATNNATPDIYNIRTGSFNNTGTGNASGGQMAWGGAYNIAQINFDNTAGQLPSSLRINANNNNGTTTRNETFTITDGSTFINVTNGANVNMSSGNATSFQGVNLLLNYTGTGVINIDGTSSLIVGGNGTNFLAVSGQTAAVTKSGAGTLTLTTAGSTYTGGFNLSQGTLQIGSTVAGTNTTSSISKSPYGTGTLTLSGGTLMSNSTVAKTVINNVALNGSVTLGDATNTGALTISAGAGSATTLTANSVLTTASAVTWAQAISGGYSLTKSGTGTLTLNGANTYTGNTIINNGTLALGASASLSSASVQIAAGATFDATAGGFTVASGKSFGGDGTAAGAITFASGGNLLFSTTSTLDVTGAVTFGGFGITNLVGLSSATPLNTYTLLHANGGSISQTNVSNIGALNTYDLGSGVGAYFDFANGDLSAVVVSYTAVPEPSTYAAIAGAMAMLGVMIRRRSKVTVEVSC